MKRRRFMFKVELGVCGLIEATGETIAYSDLQACAFLRKRQIMKSSTASTPSIFKKAKPVSPDTARLRFCLLGGFLGAGKTSLLREFAKWLDERGLRVGLVANDQAGGRA
jgi:signal recognition particle GTPase